MVLEAQGNVLLDVVILLGAGVLGAAAFQRLGLGSVLGYFAGGVLVGPSGLGLFTHPQAILHLAELGVVLLLFLVGLEMQPARLWSLRRQIFGLGVAQVVVCGALLTGAAALAGFPPWVAFLAAMGFVLSSTAAVAQELEQRGETTSPRGQRIVAILLLEDLAIVPLLAIVALAGPATEAGGARWSEVGIALAAVMGLVAAGRRLLDPLFRVLAALRAREVMTAAALLLVLGAALLMEQSGLSTALGAFLAGVLFSESSFRHQLEADVDPFRSVLLGIFFLSVGMSLDLALVAGDAPAVLATVAAAMAIKGAGVYAVAWLLGSTPRDALHRAALMAQGGEFAFVLFAHASKAALFDEADTAFFTAVVILSMAATPLLVRGLERVLPAPAPSLDGIDPADGLRGTVLIIGFGRFGQVMSQVLLARGIDVTIIDRDVEMIRSAAEFGFKVYYGDGGRLDVLRASGAFTARAIAVCVDDRAAASRIVEVLRAQCPLSTLLVRAYDRVHALELIRAGVEHPVRETFESALALGEQTLRALGVAPEEAAATCAEVRRRDAERVRLELAGGLAAGRGLLLGNVPRPTPLTPPRHSARPLSAETAAVTGGDPAAVTRADPAADAS
ncbi:MAG TPA: monovalent cation:proton antiporter-2 (CPA2) family protein [Myxococcota bacterium]